MRRSCVPAAFALVLALSFLAAGIGPGLAHAAPTTTFAEEFNGPAGAVPDRTRWAYDVGGDGWGNQELENYTRSASNASLDGDGHLVITARQTGALSYTSTRLVTRGRFAQAYGHFEARMRMPAGAGLWPAFWLLGANCGEDTPYPRCGEIDVVENCGDPTAVSTHAHGPHLVFGHDHAVETPTTGWHTYAVDWTPVRLSWWVDGKFVQTMTKSQARRGWVFDHPFYLIVNLAVGGDWPGAPAPTTRFPAQLLVDEIRVTTS